MPSASRRSGTAHTSKASSKNRTNGEQAEASSSSIVMDAGMPTSSQEHLEAGKQEDDIYELLKRFDKQTEPLTKDTGDNSLRTLRADWSSMENNFEIVYQLLSDVGERLADARAAEGLGEEDDNMQALDLGIRGMIDLREEVKFRKLALEELRSALNGGDVRDAKATYEGRTTQLIDDYNGRTIRQKYIKSDVYRKYKSTVWGALRDEDMPPLADLLPNDGQDDDSDEDIVAYGGDRAKFKCPLSLQIMVNPLVSKVCPHAFEKTSILQFLGNHTKSCPSGCGKTMNKNSFKEDQAFTNACRKFARREQIRRETQRTQGATDLD